MKSKLRSLLRPALVLVLLIAGLVFTCWYYGVLTTAFPSPAQHSAQVERTVQAMQTEIKGLER
jgi:hypothetical protein